jgi:hypothetical protein
MGAILVTQASTNRVQKHCYKRSCSLFEDLLLLGRSLSAVCDLPPCRDTGVRTLADQFWMARFASLIKPPQLSLRTLSSLRT